MAKLSDIHESNKGHEQESEASRLAPTLGQDDKPEIDNDPDGVVIFRLANNKKKGGVWIDGGEVVWNEDTKRMEKARCLTGVDSIWMKDQKDLDKDYVRQNLRSFRFENRMLRVQKRDTLALKYLRLTKHFIKDPSKDTGGMYGYFEWNPQRQAEAALAKRKEKISAMRKAMDAPIEKVKKHAFYLGVSPVDEYGIPKKDEAIRDEYVLKAEENHVLFNESYDSLVVDVSFLIRKALSDSKIDLGKERGRAYFSSGGFICSIPPTRNAIEVLIELATSKTPEGKEFLERLQSVVG